MLGQIAARWRRSVWDGVGAGLSGLCVVHCLILPVLPALLPLWELSGLLHDWAHPVFALLLAPPALVVMGRTGGRPALLLGIGLVAVFGAWLAHEALGAAGDTALTLLGSVLLVAGHWQNGRRCHGSMRVDD